MSTIQFTIICLLVGLVVYVSAHLFGVGYLFFAGYTILQFIVLSSAWNILGGYCGYVNFGSAAFFALGAYSTVFFYKFYPLPIPILIMISAVVSGIVGFGMGYLTLAAARRLLCHRNPGDGGGAADAGRQLGPTWAARVAPTSCAPRQSRFLAIRSNISNICSC